MKRTLALLLVLTAACDKNDAAKFADAYCAEIAKCCGQAGLPADGKQCRRLFDGFASRGWFNAAAADACLAETRSRVSAGTFCTGFNPLTRESSPSACTSIIDTSFGSAKPGADCVQTDDCAPSPEGEVKCVLADGYGYVHRCQVRMRGKPGDSPCVGTQGRTDFESSSSGTNVLAKVYVCNVLDGLRCVNDACTALAGLGDGCSSSSECVPDAYCDPSSSRCVARVAAGGTCAGADTFECGDGFYCPSSGAQQCTAKLAQGASCTSNAMCQGSCANHVCYGGDELALYCGS
jgi:hypothetical protein